MKFPFHAVTRGFPLWLVAVALLTGCASTISPAVGTSSPSATPPGGRQTTTTTTGTLKGSVVAGPTCAVQPIEGTACPPQPVPGRQVNIVTVTHTSVATTMTDDAGNFTIKLPPGTYLIEVPIVKGQVGMRQVAPVQVTIVAGVTAQAQVMLDTGIRIPVVPGS